jgi:hypothetical protein
MMVGAEQYLVETCLVASASVLEMAHVPSIGTGLLRPSSLVVIVVVAGWVDFVVVTAVLAVVVIALLAVLAGLRVVIYQPGMR